MKETAHVFPDIPLRNKDTTFAVFSEKESFQISSPVKNDCYILILAIKGTIDITVGHYSFTLASESMCIISPQLIYSLENSSNDFIAIQIFFQKNFLYKSYIKEQIIDDLLYLNPDYPPFYVLEKEIFQNVFYKFKMIAEEQLSEKPFHLNIIRLTLIELLYDYNRACEYCLLGFKKNMNRQYQLTHQFKKLVDARFISSKAVSYYAILLNVSAKHLSETVKEETGLTALEIIHSRLLLEIQYLLKHTTLSIKEIAFHLQFDNTSHFSRFFKSKTNQTPLKYRKIP